MEESATASYEMEKQAKLLASLMDYFKLSASDFSRESHNCEEDAARGADVVPLVIKVEAPGLSQMKGQPEKGAHRTGTSDDGWEEF